MTGRSLIEWVCEGMDVQTLDGVILGKITQIWCGAKPVTSYTPCEEESYLEVQGGLLYLPGSIIAMVSGKVVTLCIDAATVHTKAWQWKPP
jgi:hypothetical protein